MRKLFLAAALLFFLLPQTALAAPPPCTDNSWCSQGYLCVAGIHLTGHDSATKYCYNTSTQTTTNPLTTPRNISSTTGGSSDCINPQDANTALGCIPTEPAELVKWILKYAILMGGGIAFLLSIWGGATILLSAGNPEKINEGREIITSAISGLLFIVLSVFLLRLIGVDILGIPGFTK